MTTLGLRTLYHWMTIPWSTYPLFGLFCTPETKLDTTHVATRYILVLFMTELGIEPSSPARGAGALTGRLNLHIVAEPSSHIMLDLR